VTLNDFELAEAIFIIGQNPGTNHPRMMTSKEQREMVAKLFDQPAAGTRLIRFKHPQEVWHDR